MKSLTILYDAECALCRRCRVWLAQQPTYVPLHFLPLQAEALRARFPGIDRLQPERELIVISDTGDVWQGASAWVMCLWALREYREWSQRLAHPLLLPLARRVCGLVSTHRHEISRALANDTTTQLAARLATVRDEECADRSYCKAR